MTLIWRAMPSMNVRYAKFILILFLVFAAAAILRIYNLDAESLWYDEVASVNQATVELSALFSRFHLSPLYFFILRCWIRIFGTSEFSLRLPSVIAGVISVFLTYRIGDELFGRRTGLISSFILAISPLHIFYSQEARHYGFSVFFTLLSVVYFLKLLKNGYGKITYICYVAATAALLYTHIFGVFIAAIQNFYFFSQHSTGKKQWTTAQLIIFAIFLLWLIPYIIFLREQKEYVAACIDWIPKANFSVLTDTFRTFSYGGDRYGGSDVFVGSRLGVSKSLFYIMAALCAAGALPFPKQKYNNKIIFISLWLFIPPLVLFIFSLFSQPLFVIRYVIFASPAYYLLIARGISGVGGTFPQIWIIASMAFLTLPSLIAYYTGDLKIDWRRTISYVETGIRTGENIIVAPSHCIQMFGYYGKNGAKFQNKDNVSVNIIQDLGITMLKGGFAYTGRGNKMFGIKNLNQMESFFDSNQIKKEDNIWYISARWFRNSDEVTKIDEYMEKTHRIKEKRDFSGAVVRHYEAREFIK